MLSNFFIYFFLLTSHERAECFEGDENNFAFTQFQWGFKVERKNKIDVNNWRWVDRGLLKGIVSQRGVYEIVKISEVNVYVYTYICWTKVRWIVCLPHDDMQQI